MPDLGKISVIVPVYNLEKELTACISSLIIQSYSNIEIIIVDDGSKDDSWCVIERLAAEDPRIIPIHQENAGVTIARLTGIQCASGEFIGFVDGDDVIEQDMYERLLMNLLNHRADISHCGYQMVFPDGRIHYFYKTGKLFEHDRSQALTELLDGSMIEPGLCTKLFKRSLFSNIQALLDTSIKINEDLLMNYLVFDQSQRSVFEDICPYHYIVRKGSASRQKLEAHHIIDPIRVKQIILDIASPDIAPIAKRALLNTVIDSYGKIAMHINEFDEEIIGEVRTILLSNWDAVRELPLRRRFLAQLIRTIPAAYPKLYYLYARFFQKNPYR